MIWFDHATGAFSSIPNEGSQRFVLGRHPPEWPLRPVVDGVGAPLTYWEWRSWPRAAASEMLNVRHNCFRRVSLKLKDNGQLYRARYPQEGLRINQGFDRTKLTTIASAMGPFSLKRRVLLPLPINDGANPFIQA